jgi:hypothetical protein
MPIRSALWKELNMFRTELVNPATGRPVYLPDQSCWDQEKAVDVGDVFKELQAMSGLPLDVQITRRGMPLAELRFRREVQFIDDSITGEDDREWPDRGLRIEVKGIEPILLSEAEFIAANISPGFVHAVFRSVALSVSRVSLIWWRALD